MDKQGILMCAKYAASPNLFGFCGPQKGSNIIDHLKENIADNELGHILGEFETLYPYLEFIARENKISEPLSKQVVEAYWIGNNLLKNIKDINYLHFLSEKLLLEKKIDKENFQKIKRKVLSFSFLPHHSFHVFNIFRRTGKDSSFHTVHTMDECRISWGKIMQYQISNIKYQNDKSNIKYLIVKTNPLVNQEKKLKLGDVVIKEVKINYNNNQFIKNIRPGNWLSFHWGMVCDVINEKQVKNLEFYTQKAINYYNS